MSPREDQIVIRVSGAQGTGKTGLAGDIAAYCVKEGLLPLTVVDSEGISTYIDERKAQREPPFACLLKSKIVIRVTERLDE